VAAPLVITAIVCAVCWNSGWWTTSSWPMDFVLFYMPVVVLSGGVPGNGTRVLFMLAVLIMAVVEWSLQGPPREAFDLRLEHFNALLVFCISAGSRRSQAAHRH